MQILITVNFVQEGKNYLAAMSCAANYAWVNRSSMTFLVRQAFQKMFKQQADDLDMHVGYDVSHNIAKVPLLILISSCSNCPRWMAFFTCATRMQNLMRAQLT